MLTHSKTSIAIGFCLLLTTVASGAQPHCMARVTADVHAIENPTAVMHKGPWSQVTQLRINKADGSTRYCAHGDYCYPTEHVEIYTPCTFATAAYDLGDEWEHDSE